jgi:hypothetical protein
VPRRRERPREDDGTRLLAHRWGELVAEIAEEPSFASRHMFGCLACYAHGRLMLLLADRRPPWHGVLVPMAREHHAALRRDVPGLRVHPVLAKWLHLPPGAAAFEASAARLATLARAGDPRLGVEPRPRRRRGAR